MAAADGGQAPLEVNLSSTYALNESKEQPHANLFNDHDSHPCSSDADETLIVYAPFRDIVRITHMAVTAPAGPTAPTSVKLYVNRRAFGFEDTESVVPTHTVELGPKELTLSEDGSRVLIKLPLVKFTRVTSVHLFFENEHEDNEEEKTVITALAFYGQGTKRPDVGELKKPEGED